MVESDFLVLGFAPKEDCNAEAQTRTCLEKKLLQLFENFSRHILEHWGDNLLLERRQMLSY